MKRTVFLALMLGAILFVAFSAVPSPALAWGPCNGPYGGYAGCSGAGYYGGYSGGYYGGYNAGYYGGYSPYYGGYGYNRVCRYGYWGQLYCTYVLVPPYPVSGYYGYVGYWGY